MKLKPFVLSLSKHERLNSTALRQSLSRHGLAGDCRNSAVVRDGSGVDHILEFWTQAISNAVDLTLVPFILRQARDERNNRNIMKLKPFVLSLSKHEWLKSTALPPGPALSGQDPVQLGVTRRNPAECAPGRMVSAP
jgi:hypothetical protein